MFCGLLLIGVVYKSYSIYQDGLVCDFHFSGGATISGLPVAYSTKKKTRGLSGTNDIGKGMAFVWSNEEPRVFWMKDTYVPLSIAFIDKDGFIFSIVNMSPHSEKHHYSSKPAQLAIELKQGQFKNIGISVGSQLIQRKCSYSILD